MRTSSIGDLFRIQTRFLRSAQLERDFEDASALDGYVLTPQLSEHLDRIFAGLAPHSGQRAWRITGDYGVGKSSFALLLTHFLAGQSRGLPKQLRGALSDHKPQRSLLPVLVTGSREPVAMALLRALRRSLEQLYPRRARIFERLDNLIEASPRQGAHDNSVVEVVQECAVFASAHGANGLLIVLDELGKFLEFAAQSPDRQDVYFLQLLGEAAARSRETPIVVVGLLHQAFDEYAERLADSVQREWQKVAGRYQELLFDRPLDQTSMLIAEALNLRVDELPKAAVVRARSAMADAAKLGWYGSAKEADLLALAPRLYPIHPTVTPPLARLFSRFGQNERSLFSFLLSSEPFALQAYAVAAVSADRFYRVHNLYDYARAVFGARLSAQSYRTHWNLLESIVESFATDEATEMEVLKTVAVLNLIDEQGLLATSETLTLAIASDDEKRVKVSEAIKRLLKLRVLHYRGGSGSFCLWPHTSVNIERVYEQSQKSVPAVRRVTEAIAKELDTRPLVARRHYIETGNLRHFSVHYVGLSELTAFQRDAASDGSIVVPLCETAADCSAAREYARSTEVRADRALLIAVPRPLESLRSMVLGAQRWQWVLDNTPDLGHDRFATEEVSRELTEARRVLRDRLQGLFGVRGSHVRSELEWYRCGKAMKVASSRDLLSMLSTVCDEVYCDAPRVRNELVNRRELSSAAAAARMRLIEHIVDDASSPLLGMDAAKKPPEMSMYLSVLRHGNMHIQHADSWLVVQPSPRVDTSNVLPSFARIDEVLRAHKDARVKISDIFEALRPPPLGVRDGLAPLLLAVYVTAHYDSLAFYEDGAFLPTLCGKDFMRIVKAPESFEMQLCEVTGVRAAVFAQLAELLELGHKKSSATLLDVVRAVCSFAADLPRFTHGTQKLEKSTRAVRDVLLDAKEPGTLIFRELPKALGFEPFVENAARTKNRSGSFVKALRESFDELRGAYARLLNDIEVAVYTSSGQTSREAVAVVAERLLLRVHESKLRGFCMRLADRTLPHVRWVESLAAFVASKPPSVWSDRDAAGFHEEFARYMESYRRVQATSFSDVANGSASQESYVARLAITLHDGHDIAQVVHMNAEQATKVAEIEAQLQAVLRETQQLGLVAAARVLWRALAEQTH